MSQQTVHRRQPKSSYLFAYLLCITLGWLGMHRFYLRRYWSGLLYAFSFGVLGIGILVDLLTLPVLVKEQRDREAGLRRRPELAPWAANESKGLICLFQLLIRYSILILMPAFVLVAAISLGQYTIVVLMFLIMAFSLLIGSVGRCLGVASDFKEEIELVPFLPTAINAIQRFDRHYMNHRVGSVFYYLMYPVMGPLSLLFSAAARSEFRCYLGIFAILFLTIIGENLWSYPTVYPSEYFDDFFGLNACIFMAFAGIILCFLCVIPVVSSSFYMDMTGRGLSLRFCAAIGLILAGLSVYWVSQNSTITVRGAMTTDAKLYQSQVFREELRELSEFFLKSQIKKQGSPSESEGQSVAIDSDRTAWYHKVVAGILREEELAAFRVLRIESAEGQHLAIQFVSDPIGLGGITSKEMVLFSVSPNGTIVSRQADSKLKDKFVIETDTQAILDRLSSQDLLADNGFYFRRPEILTSYEMFDDLTPTSNENANQAENLFFQGVLLPIELFDE